MTNPNSPPSFHIQNYQEKDTKIAVDLCATIRHMVKGEIKEEEEIDEAAATASDHDNHAPKQEENEDDEHMEMNEDENDNVVERQKRI